MPLFKGTQQSLTTIICLGFFPSLTFAIDHNTNVIASSKMGSLSHSSFVVTISGGPAWVEGTHNDTFFLAPGIEKSYVPNSSSKILGVGEIFLGMQGQLNARFEGQLGLEFAATGDNKLSGMVWDDANPTFNNYTYSYNVQHWHVAVKGKALTNTALQLKPYVSGSIGVGFNQSNKFINTPIIPEALVMPNFSSHTNTTWAFTVGAGVQREVYKHWQIGVGYELMYWGRSSLGTAPGQPAGGGVPVNHLYTNGLMFNLTYLS